MRNLQRFWAIIFWKVEKLEWSKAVADKQPKEQEIIEVNRVSDEEIVMYVTY